MKKFLLTLLLVFGLTAQGWCATVTWQGDESALWSTGGNWDTGSAPDATSDVVINNAAACNLAASTTVNSVNFTGYTGTFTHNASVTLTIDGQNGGGDSLIMAAGMTYTFTAATSRITFTGAGTSDITCAGITLPNVTFNNSGDTFSILDELKIGGSSATALYLQAGTFTHNNNAVTLNGTTPTINGAFSFYTLNRTGTAVKTDTLLLASNITVTNTLNIDGNSGVNRVLVASDTLGTARTLTITGATISGCSNVDFRDITFDNDDEDVNLASITGGSGDCGGNTIVGAGRTLSFTTADDWYWYGSGTRNFSDYTYWYDAAPDSDSSNGSQMASTRCPLPQDTCYIAQYSIITTTRIDQDLPRVPGIDCTGASAFTFDFDNVAQELYGGLVLVNGLTITGGSGKSVNFYGRGSYNLSYPNATVAVGVGVYMVGGTLTCQSNITTNASYSAGALGISNGTFDANDYNISVSSVSSSNSNTRTINMGSGSWDTNYITAGNNWNFDTATNLTLNEETSTIYFGTSTNGHTFNGGSQQYYNIIFENTTTDTITGSNTFNTFTINAPKTIKFTAGTTQTVASFVATGSAGNLIHIDSTSASDAYLSDSTGTNQVYYCHIGETGDVDAIGGATWLAYTTDSNEVNGSEGWTTASGATYFFRRIGAGITEGVFK